MHESRPHSPSPLLAVALCALGGLLFALPSDISDTIKSTFHDAATPGLVACDAVGENLTAARDWMFDRTEDAERIAELEGRLAESESHRWRLLLENESLLSPRKIDLGHSPLILPELLPARILGTEAAEAWRAGRLVDVGLDEGVREETAVLAAEGPLLDRGRDGEVDAGDSITTDTLDGRTLVGRVRTVGRWTSVVQPITDAEYRVRVQLAHETARGLVLGPTGILRGTGGPTCRLEFVGSTESVEAGDDVFALLAVERSEAFPLDPTADAEPSDDDRRLYVGRVSKADLPSGAPHWEIEVTPATPVQPHRVAVLRRRFNPERTLEQ